MGCSLTLCFVRLCAEVLLKSTDHNGFPVIVSTESQYLVGFVLRKDLTLALANARKCQDGVVGNSRALFVSQVPTPWSGPPPVTLRRILDLASGFKHLFLRKKWNILEERCAA